MNPEESRARELHPQKMEDVAIHTLSVQEAYSSVDSSPNGIRTGDVERRRQIFGLNSMTVLKGETLFWKYAKHFFNGFSIGFILCGVLCLAVYKATDPPDVQTMYLGAVLIVLVFLCGLFDCYQDYKASKVLSGFNQLMGSTSNVLRDGDWVNLPSEEIVVGDLVRLQIGDRIPADMRVIESYELKVDFSTLTGETEPLLRSVNSDVPKLTESPNICFAGTFVKEGKGICLVYSVGDHTFLGTIAANANQAKPPTTNLEEELQKFVYVVAIGSLIIGVVFAALGAAVSKLTWVACISFFIAGVVANVPEGLLPQLSVQMTLTAKDMAAENALVKNMKIIETIGVVTLIATDKTGTLTTNVMSVAHYWINGTLNTSTSAKSEKIGDLDSAKGTFEHMLQAVVLNNDSHFQNATSGNTTEDSPVLGGNATDIAFLRFGQSVMNVEDFRLRCTRRREIPFNSTTKLAFVVTTIGERHILHVKGAVERVMERSISILHEGEPVPLDRHSIMRTNKELSSLGERVLALAYRELSVEEVPGLGQNGPDADFPMDGLTFIGLISLIDPPRPEVPPSIETCHAAGVQVVMVTGDHPLTAAAIARKVGIFKKSSMVYFDYGRKDTSEERIEVTDAKSSPEACNALVVHGDDLDSLTQPEWDLLLRKKEIVFARILPAQKRKIVTMFQSIKHKVVVTGDGTNDVPALKQADCGIAMGLNGTPIAKDAAQVILLDDNFASIVKGIEHGRLMFHNMKKCIFYTICNLLPELLPFTMLLAFKYPLAMETVAVLAIDLGTEMPPAIAFSFEPAEGALMQLPPRNLKKDRLYSWRLFTKAYLFVGVVECCTTYGAFLLAMHLYGFPLGELFGLGPIWISGMDRLSDDQRAKFQHLEAINTVWREPYWQSKFPNFTDYRQFALDSAQGTFLWALVVSQTANGWVTARTFTSFFHKTFRNWRLFVGNIISFIIITFVTCVPGLKEVFGAERPDFRAVCLALVCFPIFLLTSEIQKKYTCVKRAPVLSPVDFEMDPEPHLSRE